MHSKDEGQGKCPSLIDKKTRRMDPHSTSMETHQCVPPTAFRATVTLRPVKDDDQAFSLDLSLQMCSVRGQGIRCEFADS